MAPWFDGTGFQCWKVLMQAFLQARGLNVWRVVSEGMKNDGHQERQYDVIAKSIILSSLCDNVFHRVFASKNSFKLWKTINENHGGTKDVANERYHVLIDKLNSFEQFDHEDDSSMY
jgi:hypothetical protein